MLNLKDAKWKRIEGDKNMEMGESSAQSKEQTKIPKDVETIKIRFSVFFDGTLNNKTNIDQRLLSAPDNKLTEEERKAAVELKQKTSTKDQRKATTLYKKHGAKKEDEENSYEGYYTNVAIMEKYVEDSAEYQLNLQTYIEGTGTLDKAGDKTSGYAFAIWKTGIPAKVKKGVANVITLVKDNHTDKEVIIEKITLDVFGFSRGAAAARHFIHKALFGEKSLQNQLIDELNYKVQPKAVKVNFVGLYDTVSTYGVLKTALGIGSSNTISLNLDAIVHAKQVVQLAAADEHREYFSLTNIRSARSNGREIFLPGVHSDIGGGYRDAGSEKQVIYEDYGYSLDDAKREIDDQIASGRYKKDEIFLEHTLGYEGDEGDDNSLIRVDKKNISNKYSRIPLHLMAGCARDSKIKLKRKLESVEKIPSELNNVKQKIDNYVAKTKKSKASHWHHNDEAWLRDLRHDYFHFSARYSTGHTPRYNRGKRVRLTIDG